MKLKFYLMLTAVIPSFTISAQVIEGNIRPVLNDTVHLSLKREFIYGNIGVENFTAVCDSSGYFRFNIARLSHPAGINLNIKNGASQIDKNFYIESGDRLFISVTKKDVESIVTCSGRGCEKVNCKWAIDSCKVKAFRTLSGFPSKNMVDKLGLAFAWHDTLEHLLLGILHDYKSSLNQSIYELLQSDVIGWSRKEQCLMLADPVRHADTNLLKDLEKLFDRMVKLPTGYRFSAFSDEFIEYLIRMLQDRLLFLYPGGKYSMKELYIRITKAYTGITRDRLISAYLLRGQSNINYRDFEYCLNNALTIVRSPLYKDYIKSQLHKVEKGAPAFNFSLPDPSGKLIELSDFKGKVVFLDFWFTGCYACTRLADTLEKSVVKKFDNNVVFVSICLDIEKSKWIRSIGSGNYSNSRSVNVYTEGLGFMHPLIKYYNIQGCPYTLIIDRSGKIYSAKPPSGGKEICDLLDMALQ